MASNDADFAKKEPVPEPKHRLLMPRSAKKSDSRAVCKEQLKKASVDLEEVQGALERGDIELSDLVDD